MVKTDKIEERTNCSLGHFKKYSCPECRDNKIIKELKKEFFDLFGHETGGTMGEIDFIIKKVFGDKLVEEENE